MGKKIFFGALAIVAGCLAVNTASAQIQWTPEQKAVWKTEAAIFNDFVSGQDPSEYYDDSYQGWQLKSPIPIPKANMDKAVSYYRSEGGKYLFFDAVPVVIWVKGDFAYTDYYYRAVYQDKDGKKTNDHGRWLDVLMKKGDTWVLVGDHGGSDVTPTAK